MIHHTSHRYSFSSLLLLLSLWVVPHSLAQTTEVTLMDARVDFVRTRLNSAYIPQEGKWVVGVPLLSDISVSGTAPFGFNDVVDTSGGVKRLYYDRLINNLSNNILGTEVSTDLLSIGLRKDIGYFTLSYGIRGEAFVGIDKSFGDLLIYGNMKSLGLWQEGRVKAKSQLYSELALGYATDKILSSGKLKVGTRLKVLAGHLYAGLSESDFSLFTSLHGDELRLSTHQVAHVHAPGLIKSDEKSNVDWKALRKTSRLKPEMPSSYGMGIDLGIIYDIDERWTVSLSMRDIGFIRWSTVDVLEEDLRGDKTLSFKGVDASSAFMGSLDTKVSTNTLKSLLDAVKDNFVYTTSHSVSSSLDPKVHTTVSYRPTSTLVFTGLLGGIQRLDRWRTHLAISGHWQPSKSVGTSMSVSVLQGTPLNVGWGLVLGDAFQWHIAVDNILGMNVLNLHARTGLSFRIF